MRTQINLNKDQLSNSGFLIRMAYFLVIISIILINTTSVKAQSNTFTKITDDQFPQYNPAIDGNYVVYQDRRGGGVDDIYLYNIALGDTINITSDNGIESIRPDISGDRVVWQEYRDGSWDIYYYNISRPDLGAYPMIDFPGNQEHPRIYENLLVWQDDQGGNSYDIFMYDMNTFDLTQITEEDFNQYNPDIFGNYIVYQDNRNGNEDIYMYDIFNKKETRLTDDPADQQNPTIYGSRVVWEDNRDGNWSLYMYYINYWPGSAYDNYNWKIYTSCNTDCPCYRSSYDERNPRIWGDSLIFQDNRNGNGDWDLCLYSFYNYTNGKTIPLVTEDKNQINPAISNNRIVWQDERDWNGASDYEADIWMWERPPRPPGADLGVIIVDSPDPIKNGNEIKYEIFVRNFGPQDATNVVLTTSISEKVEYLSESNSQNWNCSLIGNILTCTIGNLANDSSGTLTILVKTTEEGEITTSAAITATENDPAESNNSASAITTVKWELSKFIGSGGSPSIAMDANGKVHICYISDSWEKLLYATNKTGNWVSETLISSSDISSYAIAVDNNGYVHIAYGEGNYNAKKLMYITNTSGAWSTPEIIESNGGKCGSVCIKTDSRNNVHISYMTSPWSDGSLFYLKNTTGTWSSEIVAENCYNSSSFDLDTSDNAHFSYYKLGGGGFGGSTDEGIIYRTNSPDGIWKDAVAVEDNWQGGQMESLITDIAVDPESNPHISYVGAKESVWTEDTKYAYKTDGQWHDTIIDNGEFAGSFNSIATDINNKAHLAYYHSSSSEVRYATNVEGSWEKHMLDTNTGWGDECDIGTDTLGYVHIVYTKENKLYYVTNKPPSPEPEIDVSPKSIDFVIRAVGDTTEAKKVTIQNKGNANLQINDISLVWRDSIHFTITRNTCSDLNPDDTCSVDVVFNPQSFGDKKALLWIESNDPANPTESVILEGKGLAPMAWISGSRVFGDVTVGDSATNVYKIKNKGNTNLLIQLITIQENDASDFYYTDLPETPFNIEKNDSIMFKIVFKPGSVGDKTTILRIYTNDLDFTVVLTGKGIVPSFSVEGKVIIDENTPVNAGWLDLLWQMDNGYQYQQYQKQFSGSNTFSFLNIPGGYITLRCAPDTNDYPGYLTTYLGNVTHWSDADFFNLNKDTSGLKITLVPVPPAPGGTSDVSGIFVEENGKSGSTLSYQQYNGNGTPLKDLSVFLVNPDGSLLTYDVTDAAGTFDFKNIPAGHYGFQADYVGFFMNKANDSLIISGENQKYYISALAGNDTISIEISDHTGIEDMNSDQLIRIYPNPARDKLMIQFHGFKAQDILLLGIRDMNGKLLRSKNITLPPGDASFRINTNDLPDGVYIISITGNKYTFKTRFIKMK